MTGIASSLALLACAGLSLAGAAAVDVVLGAEHAGVCGRAGDADEGASALASVAQQMASGMGMAVGAIAVHMAAVWNGIVEPTLIDFHIALGFMALLTLARLPSFFALPRDAGAVVSGQRIG